MRIRDMQYASGFRYTRHAHDEVQVSVVVRGAMREDVAGSVHTVQPGDVIVKPAGTLHADEFDGTRIICIDFPSEEIDLPLREYAWHRGDRRSAAGLRMAVRFLRGDDVAVDVDELLAALPCTRVRDRAAAKRAAELIDPTRPLRIGSIAAELRLHPVYLTRIFAEEWGCTPREYVQRMRVRMAVHAISSTSRPLADVASDSGFSDQAHMTRAVARVTGCTPAALRRAVG